MERTEKLARIIHSEFPTSFRVNLTSRDKLLRTATFDEESEVSKKKYYRTAGRIEIYLDEGAGTPGKH